MANIDLISSNPTIMHGQACIQGTRITVSVVLACLADGMTEREVVSEYPTLSIEGIRAAAAYGARLAAEEIVPLPRGEE